MFKKAPGFAGMFLKEGKQNARELAKNGIFVYPKSLVSGLKVGSLQDFYSKKDGSKLQGTVKAFDGKTISMKCPDGTTQKFTFQYE